VLYGGDSFSVRVLVFVGLAVPDKLLAGSRVLAFRKPRKLLSADGAGEAEPLCKPPLPFACHVLSAAPITLIGRSEFLGMVRLRLTGTERL
jgi:hypothetical protein